MQQQARTAAGRPEGRTEGKPDGERGGVQSLERAFAILDRIAQAEDGIILAELSRMVGLHTSTTFHLVRTMVELEAVRQDRTTKRYYLGRRLFSLAASATGEISLVAMATPLLEDLAQDTGETTHLALMSGDAVVIVARIPGSGAFQLVEREGGVRPAHSTSVGKVLLAALPDERLEAFLQSASLVRSTPHTICEPSQLRAEIERVRRAGVAYDDAEFMAEVRCIAAPVHDFTGKVVAAAGLSGPIWRMTLERMTDLEERIRRTAAELSRQLGHRDGQG